MVIEIEKLTNEPQHFNDLHATLKLTAWDAIEIKMDEGWGFYQTTDFCNYDEEGNFLGYYEPTEEEIAYSTYCLAPKSVDFSTFVIRNIMKGETK